MAKIALNQLFLDAFIKYNEQRYADSRVDLPRFQGLELSEVVFGKVTNQQNHTATITELTSETRKFVGTDQAYTKAYIVDEGISVVLSTDYPYEDVVTAKALSAPGLTVTVDDPETPTKVNALLIYPAEMAEDEATILGWVQTTLKDACNYELTDDMINVIGNGDGTWTSYVISEMIYGDILTVKSEVPILDIPATDYGELGEPMVVSDPYPPVPEEA